MYGSYWGGVIVLIFPAEMVCEMVLQGREE